MSWAFSPQVRILILDSSSFFDLKILTGIHSEPPKVDVAPSDPQGQVPDPFSYPLSKVNATKLNGGTAKIVDSTTFKVSTRIAVADVTVEPGALRELHVRVHLPFFAIIVALILGNGM
jgi:oxalate decarboxylase/phosphoglucose isomerase-like protein (cupin superfamily)